MSGWVLGIDFGTTSTAAATLAEGDRRAELVRFGDSSRLPSAVFVGDDGVPVAGRRVEQELAVRPERVERCPKRQLGQGRVLVADRWLDDVDLVTAVLSCAREAAVRLFNGRPPATVRLTHPVRWEDTRQGALREAAARAGMPDVELLAEPIAAASALARRSDGGAPGDRVAVFDFGGGTLDIALLERTATGFRLAGPPGGDEHLGGEDVDDLLVAHLVGQLPDPAERAALSDPESTDAPAAWRRAAVDFVRQVRLAKEALSDTKLVPVPLVPPVSVPSLELSEGDLRSVVADVVRTAISRLETAVQRAGLEPSDLAAVYLVGGSSRLAAVQRQLGRKLGVEFATWGDPKGLVALGAAEHGAVELGLRPPTTPATERVSVPAEPARSEPARPGPPRPERAQSEPAWSEPAQSQPAQSQPAQSQPAQSEPARPPQDVRVRQGVPVLTAAEALQALGAPPTALRVERWLVERGAFLPLNAPVLEATLLDGSGRRLTLHGQHAGVVDRRFPAPGTEVTPGSALLTVGGVRAFVALPSRLTGQETGVLLALPARPRYLDGRPEAWVVTATVAEVPTTVWWGSRVAFLLPPGSHRVAVAYPLGGKTGGSARTRVTVAPGRLVAVRYDPPGFALPSPPLSAAGGPGWLCVSS